MRTMSNARFTLMLACALLAGATLGAGPARALPILPGFDLFTTVSPGTTICHEGHSLQGSPRALQTPVA